MHERREEGWIDEDGCSLDFAAAVGGLLLLKHSEACLAVLGSSEFRNRFPFLTLAHLVLAVNAFDNGLLGEHQEYDISDRLRSNLEQASQQIYKSSPMVQATAKRVANYIGDGLAKELGWTGLPVYEQGQTTAAGDVATIAGSSSFWNYVCDVEDEAHYHLPLMSPFSES